MSLARNLLQSLLALYGFGPRSTPRRRPAVLIGRPPQLPVG
jgi:hypothetical protein